MEPQNFNITYIIHVRSKGRTQYNLPVLYQNTAQITAPNENPFTGSVTQSQHTVQYPATKSSAANFVPLISYKFTQDNFTFSYQ